MTIAVVRVQVPLRVLKESVTNCFTLSCGFFSFQMATYWQQILSFLVQKLKAKTSQALLSQIQGHGF